MDFLNRNINTAFQAPAYFMQLEGAITACMLVALPELRQRADEELKAVKVGRPTTTQSRTNQDWQDYYYALTGICFDYCGPQVMRGLGLA